jgi:hypothetical protein
MAESLEKSNTKFNKDKEAKDDDFEEGFDDDFDLDED